MGTKRNGYACIGQTKYQHRGTTLKTKCKMRLYQMVNVVNAKQCVKVFVLLTLGTLATIIYFTNSPAPMPRCWVSNEINENPNDSEISDHQSDAAHRIAAKVLVFVQSAHSTLNRDIAELLVYNRIKYVVHFSIQ